MTDNPHSLLVPAAGKALKAKLVLHMHSSAYLIILFMGTHMYTSLLLDIKLLQYVELITSGLSLEI